MTDTPSSRVLAEATDYMSLLDAFRARAEEIGITKLEIDDIGGLTDGYASKLLAPIPMKGAGMRTLGKLLRALALKLVVVEDEAMRRRVERRLRHAHRHAGQRRLSRDQRAALVGAPAAAAT